MDDEVVYKFVKGKGWVASYAQAGVTLTVTGFSFCRPGDKLTDHLGNMYVVESNNDEELRVRLISEFRNIVIQGVVSV